MKGHESGEYTNFTPTHSPLCGIRTTRFWSSAPLILLLSPIDSLCRLPKSSKQQTVSFRFARSIGRLARSGEDGVRGEDENVMKCETHTEGERRKRKKKEDGGTGSVSRKGYWCQAR